LQIFFFTEQIYSNFELRLNNIFTFENNLDILYSIDLIGQSLYNYFMLCFLIAGLILLVALIGAIVLTLRFISIRESELVSRQLSRSDNFLAFFK
jgi:NADH:ubiquinone oxidoreductase subunit 6 (subunit J)